MAALGPREKAEVLLVRSSLLGFQDFLMGSATGDIWVMNRLLAGGGGGRGITPGGAHGQVISRGGRGPQSVLGEQPQAAELLDRSGDQGGICRCPGPGSRERDTQLGPEPGVPGVPAPGGHH